MAQIESDPPAKAAWKARPDDWPVHRGDFRRALRWLWFGAFAYALLLAIALWMEPEMAEIPIVGPSVYLTPVFGTGYAVIGFRRRGRLRRVLFLLLGIPLAHAAANYAAWAYGVEHYPHMGDGAFRDDLMTGALGGVTGASLSFVQLLLLGLVPRRRCCLWIAAVGVVVLGAVGAAAMAYGLRWSGAVPGFHRLPVLLWFETVHLPWQLLFALFLALLLHVPPKRNRSRRARAA